MGGGKTALLGSILGVGDVTAPNTKAVGKDYRGLLTGYQSGAQPLFDTESEFAPKYAGLTMDMLEKFLPGMSSLLTNADPASANLLTKLTGSASEGLDQGRSFDRRTFDNDIMSKAGTRGMGFGPADAIREAVARGNEGERVLNQRQATAGAVSGQGFQQKIAPLIQLLTQLVGGAQSNFLKPAGSLDLMKIPYAGKLAAHTSTAANNTSLWETADTNATSMYNNSGGGLFSAFGK